MKTNLMNRVLPHLMLAGVCAGLSLCPARAQEKPAETRPKPAAAKVPFLGLALGPVDEALASQIGLSPGVGVLVRAVMPDSPAAKAGVQQHDVLHRFNDQLLVNEPQLQTLVHQAGIGAEVKLSLFRKGKDEVVTVKLGEHEAMEPEGDYLRRAQEMQERERVTRRWHEMRERSGAGAEPSWVPPMPMNGDAFANQMRELQERLKETQGNAERMRAEIERFQQQVQEMARQKSEMARERAKSAAREAHRPSGNVQVQVTTDDGTSSGSAYSVATANSDGKGNVIVIQNGVARTKWSDGDGSGELVSENGEKNLTVKDRQGKVIFSGPVNTEEQRKALPAEVRERVERIEKGVKVEIKPAPPAKTD